jgi:hypothetical protein
MEGSKQYFFVIVVNKVDSTKFQISGEAGSGKTNFCLQACLQTQLKEEDSGLNGSALYISTEVRFSFSCNITLTLSFYHTSISLVFILHYLTLIDQ